MFIVVNMFALLSHLLVTVYIVVLSIAEAGLN